MPHRHTIFSAMLCASLLPLIGAGSAAAFGFDRETRQCEDTTILKRIESRFRHQVRNVPHLPDVEIESIDRIHQHRYLPARENRPIARRYCHATAHLSNGHHRKIWYLIENGQGFAGVGDNVEFCVSGFDRWNVYNSYCRILR